MFLRKNLDFLYFYNLEKQGSKRSGTFDLELNHPVDNAHLIIQVPLVAEGFLFSEKDSEEF